MSKVSGMPDEFVQAGFYDFMILHPGNGIGKVLFQRQQGMNPDHQPDDEQNHADGKKSIPSMDPACFRRTDWKWQGIAKSYEAMQPP